MKELRTPNQIKWDKIRAKTISLYEEMANVDGSNWQKFETIASKQKVSPHYVMKVIKLHNESKATDQQSN